MYFSLLNRPPDSLPYDITSPQSSARAMILSAGAETRLSPFAVTP
jgi:hypothetical protein